MKEEKNYQVQRNYEDTLFRMIFRDKNALLSLYNAISEQECNDLDALEIVTLENAIYMNIKNDLAFIIDSSLHLYEHQSTFSPNMPLRNLFYISRELEKMVSRQSLYSSKQVKVPTPRFIVFYNGADTSWEREVKKLSDAFLQRTDQPELELYVTMLNINVGKNNDILAKCQTLLEYTQYVEKVRKYASVMDINLAVEKAVNESIKEGILADFLLKNKAEAVQMSIFEYDEEREMKLIRQDEREIGRQEGIKCFILDNLEEQVPEERIVKKLQRMFGIVEDESRRLISLYREDNEQQTKTFQMRILECEGKEMKRIQQQEREIGRQEGKREGLKEGLKEGLNEGIRCFILDYLEEQVPEERIVEKLQRRFNILEDESRRLISLYRESE